MSGRTAMHGNNETKKYSAFGEKLFEIANENLPQGKAKGKRAVVSYFNNQPELGFDTSCTYAWMRGELCGSKPLVRDNFKRILLFYMGKNGLNSIQDIKSWVSSGPQHFEELLNCEEIKAALQARKIVKHTIDHGEEMAERQKVWQALLGLVHRAGSRSSSIVIQGPPGVGKSMMLERLYADPETNARFDRVLFARSDSAADAEKMLDYWCHLLLPGQEWKPDHPPLGMSQIRSALKGQKTLLLADGLSSPVEFAVIKQLCDLGCVLVVTTRSLEVSRQVPYSSVIELHTYSKNDVLEYYTKYYDEEPSLDTQDKLFELAEALCHNPLGIQIALRRVDEEGWDTIIRKVKLAGDGCRGEMFGDLHKPFWLAYSSLSSEDQKKFCSLGTLPHLLSYDEERLALFWGVAKKQVNEILVRFEKEAGLASSIPQKSGHWRFHTQVIRFARCLLLEKPIQERARYGLYPIRMSLQQKRPCHFSFMYRRGVKSEVVRTYWRMIGEERKRRRLPIYLAELRRLVDPTYSTDWSIFERLTSNCTLEEYSWGYRIYLEGGMDIVLFSIYLAMIGLWGGFQHLIIHFLGLDRFPFLFQAISLLAVIAALIWAFHIVLRDFRRRYDWAQLWQRITTQRGSTKRDEA